MSRIALAPKGWILLIKNYIEDKEYDAAIDALNAFDNWLDEHLVTSGGSKKKGKKKK